MQLVVIQIVALIDESSTLGRKPPIQRSLKRKLELYHIPRPRGVVVCSMHIGYNAHVTAV